MCLNCETRLLLATSAKRLDNPQGVILTAKGLWGTATMPALTVAARASPAAPTLSVSWIKVREARWELTPVEVDKLMAAVKGNRHDRAAR